VEGKKVAKGERLQSEGEMGLRAVYGGRMINKKGGDGGDGGCSLSHKILTVCMKKGWLTPRVKKSHRGLDLFTDPNWPRVEVSLKKVNRQLKIPRGGVARP